MNHDNWATAEEAQRDVACLAILESVIDDGNNVTIKDGRDVREINSVLMEVDAALGFVPLESHTKL